MLKNSYRVIRAYPQQQEKLPGKTPAKNAEDTKRKFPF
jgi:hypothetical protein